MLSGSGYHAHPAGLMTSIRQLMLYRTFTDASAAQSNATL